MLSIPCLTINNKGVSIFTEKAFSQTDRNGMWLTEQIAAKNFRIRTSAVGYQTHWHVAGDATLIIIQAGILKITLQNMEVKEFVAGTMFIAADFLPEHKEFDNTLHGHKATVIGHQDLLAIHIKLDNFKFED